MNLRHDAAHGHDLPVIDLLRMASNVLLSWLDDEYWRPEAQAMEKSLQRRNDISEVEEIESSDGLIDLIELWMSLGLYIESNFLVASDLPDAHLRETLKDLHSHSKMSKRDLDTSIPSEFDEDRYRLKTARSYLFTELSNEIRRSKDPKSISKIVIDLLINSEVFLVTSELLELFSRDNKKNYDNLPKRMIDFWRPMISLLHETEILEILTLKLVEIVNCKDWSHQKRRSAALWLKTIGQSFVKLKISHKEGQIFEHSQTSKKKTPQKLMNQKLQEIIHKRNQSLKGSPWLGVNSNVPRVFENEQFTSEIILNANEWTHIFISPFLDCISPEMSQEKKKNLLDFLKIQNSEEIVIDDDDDGDDDADDDDNGKDNDDVVHTVEDFRTICGGEEMEVIIDDDVDDQEEDLEANNGKNFGWELAPEDVNWGNCALGVLPWQIDTLETLGGEEVNPEVIYPDVADDVVPGVVDNRELAGKRVNWESVLRKSQRGKRKRRREADGVMNKAIQIVKTRRV